MKYGKIVSKILRESESLTPRFKRAESRALKQVLKQSYPNIKVYGRVNEDIFHNIRASADQFNILDRHLGHVVESGLGDRPSMEMFTEASQWWKRNRNLKRFAQNYTRNPSDIRLIAKKQRGFLKKQQVKYLQEMTDQDYWTGAMYFPGANRISILPNTLTSRNGMEGIALSAGNTVHEYGHALDSALGGADELSKFLSTTKRETDNPFLWSLQQEGLPHFQTISRYATTNPAEAYAETFRDFMTPRHLVDFFGNKRNPKAKYFAEWEDTRAQLKEGFREHLGEAFARRQADLSMVGGATRSSSRINAAYADIDSVRDQLGRTLERSMRGQTSMFSEQASVNRQRHSRLRQFARNQVLNSQFKKLK